MRFDSPSNYGPAHFAPAQTTNLTKDVKARIDAMSHYDLCRTWRFAPIGDPLLQGEAGDYLKARLKALGGFTPEISKSLGH